MMATGARGSGGTMVSAGGRGRQKRTGGDTPGNTYEAAILHLPIVDPVRHDQDRIQELMQTSPRWFCSHSADEDSVDG